LSKMLNSRRIGKFLVRELTGKNKERRKKRREEKKDRKLAAISVFGKHKYYLAQLFGQWVLYL